MKHNINGVEITLTKEQIEQIAKQLLPINLNKCKYQHFTDIKDIDDAINYFESLSLAVVTPKTNIDKIQLLAAAINELDNTILKYNWYPMFNLSSSNNPIGFGYSSYCYSFSHGQVAYCKSEESSNHLGRIAEKYYLDHYNKIKVI